MTGFGRGETITEKCRITVEIKAVNHRYCDMNIKMPRKLNALEADIRDCIKKAVNRGKLDVFISYEDLSGEASGVKLNETLGREYAEALTRLSEMLEIPNDLSSMKIGRLPEVMTLEETTLDADAMKGQLIETLNQALTLFNEARVREGEHLKKDILGKLDGMLINVAKVEERYPIIVAEYRAKLTDKVNELLANTEIDENRIAAEVVLYADKICVDEETVRLRSHIDHMKAEVEKGENVGRKLDFIAQEMNREANTILSKANDIDTSNAAIELKTEIEKIREQVQNIE